MSRLLFALPYLTRLHIESFIGEIHHIHVFFMRESQQKILTAIDALPHTAPRYAVFDFDNTVIVHDITETTLAYMCERKLFRERLPLPAEFSSMEYHEALFRYYYKLIGEGDIQDAYAILTQAFAGLTKDEVAEFVRQNIVTETKNIRTRNLFGIEIETGLEARDGMKELFAALSERGIALWIVTASPSYTVAPATQVFFPDVEFTILGFETSVVDGRLTTTLTHQPTYEKKVEAIQKHIDPQVKPLLVAGDSKNDLAMLEYAEVPVVIDRGNGLKKIAEERRWIIF